MDAFADAAPEAAPPGHGDDTAATDEGLNSAEIPMAAMLAPPPEPPKPSPDDCRPHAPGTNDETNDGAAAGERPPSWDEAYEAIVRFKDRCGVLPAHGPLHDWLEGQRRAIASSTVPPARVARLVEAGVEPSAEDLARLRDAMGAAAFDPWRAAVNKKSKSSSAPDPKSLSDPPEFTGEPPNGAVFWTKGALVSAMDELRETRKMRPFLQKVILIGKTEYTQVNSIYKMYRKWKRSGHVHSRSGRPSLSTISELRARGAGEHGGAGTAAEAGPRKRGRPRGSTDTKPRKPHAKKPAPPQYATEGERKKVEAARKRIDQTQRRLEAAEAGVARAQRALDDATAAAAKAREDAATTMEADADTLLLEIGPWNNHYRMLVAFQEREGRVRFRRVDRKDYVVNNTLYASLDPDQQQKYKTLGKWLAQQRRARRAGELEPYQLRLLDRAGMEWTPAQGPGPEKWHVQYEALKEYKRVHGDCKVPTTYPQDQKLASWVRTQVTQYRNAKAGKTKGLTEERTRLLEDIGFDWGLRATPTPWEFRFTELCRYKESHGHPNVPWKWDGNRPLAYWVVKQRNMYKLLSDGKEAPLSEDQIHKLNSIGFQWSAGGKRAYDRPEKRKPAADAGQVFEEGGYDRLEED